MLGIEIKKFVVPSILLGMISAGPSFGSNTEDLSQAVEDLKKIVSIQAQKLAEVQKSSFAIGSFQQSIASEKSFQEQMGPGWVLCDGRSVVGSKYHQLKLGENIPHCGGKFLRSAGAAAAPVGKSQSDATAVNGLSLKYNRPNASTARSTASTTKVWGAKNQFNSTLTGGEHQHVFAVGQHQISHHARPAGGDGQNWGSIKLGGGKHEHTLKYSGNFEASGMTTGGAWSTTLFGGSVSFNGGDSETRPVNLTVNTFIKIT